MKRALITGITGQDGSYLAELLLEKGYEVHGLVRRAHNHGRIAHLLAEQDEKQLPLFLHHGDLADSTSVMRVLHDVQPDEVYNLGAQSDVRMSFTTPEYTGNVTGIGAVRFLEALRSLGLQSRLCQASSSELYGKVLEVPQNENTPFYPCSPYGCAKAYAFHITRSYRENYDMFAVNSILFNHESPRRGKTFVTRKITHGLVRMLVGKQQCLYLGNLEPERDWGYAPEYVEGMWRMLQQDEPDDYVLASGTKASVRMFLEHCLDVAGFSYERTGAGLNEQYIDTTTGNTLVGIDSQFYRPAETDLLLGDATKAREKLGWEPKTDIRGIARTMMEADAAEMGIALSS